MANDSVIRAIAKRLFIKQIHYAMSDGMHLYKSRSTTENLQL